MLKSMEKRKIKKYLFWMITIGVFGIAGLLLVPVVMYIVKISNRYPKAFGLFIFTAYSGKTAHPFQKNGAPFRLKLSTTQ